VALCLGTIYVIGLKIIGIKYSFVIGLIAGVMALIPYAGFIIGLSLSFIVASESMHTPSTYVFILGLFLVAQLIEGFLITPKVVGNKLGLSDFATVLILIIGGNLFGFFGLLIAIPIGSLIKKLLVYLIAEYKKSEIYS
jgi:predicted PurR-regulated permease PerM